MLLSVLIFQTRIAINRLPIVPFIWTSFCLNDSKITVHIISTEIKLMNPPFEKYSMKIYDRYCRRFPFLKIAVFNFTKISTVARMHMITSIYSS